MNSPQSLPSRFRLLPAARHLGVAPRSLASAAWRRKHGIPTLRIGRALIFERDALDRWLAAHREESGSNEVGQ